MIALALVGLALAQDPACAGSHAEWIASLEATGARQAYGCLSADEGSATALIARAADAEDSARVTRALAVWRLHRLDGAVRADEARTYNAADQRLLQDGVKARRGRVSPAPDHLLILEGMPWYAPDDSYTDGRLTAQDRANLAMLAHPPEPEPPPAPEPPAMTEDADTAGCGCAAAVTPLQGIGWVLLLGLSWRRRAAPAPSAPRRRAAPPPGA